MSKKSQKALASATILSLVMSTVVYAAPAAPTAGTPISGSSRVDTAIAIAKQSYTKWKDSKVAVIANGDNSHLVDALTVAPLAYQKQAPIFLTLGTGTLEASVIDALKAQGVTTVYVAGGTVTTAVDDQLKAAGVTSVTHLSGLNRWETAKKINAELEKVGAPSAYAVVNTNDSVADALSIAAEAAKQNIEIVLATDKDTADVPAGKTVYAVGGSGVLSDALVSKLGAKRFGGSTRYATNAEVLKGLDAGLDYTTTYVADGTNDHLVDSLPGSVLAGQTGSPIILVSDSVAPEVTDVVKGKAGKITTVVPLGGAVNPTAVQGIVNPDTTTPTTDLKAGDIDSVKAIANNKVEVTFKDGVTPASDAAAYSIVIKGTTTALEVKSATLEGTKVVLETAAQVSGKAYTITAGQATSNFTGIAAVKDAPGVDTVKGDDTNLVKVTFDKVVDKETAENVANYAISNITIKSASLDSARKVVTLTTDGLVKGKTYSLKISAVKNSDGVAMKSSVTRNFSAVFDTTAPKVNGPIEVLTNNRIRIHFTDAHGLNKAAAETLANYTISDGTNDLAVKSVKALNLNSDDDDYYETVEIETDTQTAGKKYTLAISNLADDSVSHNVPTSALKTNFYGKSEDKIAPTVSSVTSKTNTLVEVRVHDSSALGTEATNPANYEFNNDLEVKDVKIKDADKQYDKDNNGYKTIQITTSEQDAKSYKLTVKGIDDEFGNVKTKDSVFSFVGKKADVQPARVTKAVSTGSKTVVLYFDEDLDEASAEDPTNYDLGDDLGKAVKAVQDDKDAKKVTLTTAEQTVNKEYTITVDGVKDLSGNATSGLTAKFIAARTDADLDAPTVDWVEAVNKNEFRIHFNEAVKASSAGSISVDINGSASGANVLLTDDDKTLVVQYPNAYGTTYKITGIHNVVDKSNNNLDYDTTNPMTFDGTDVENDRATVMSYDETSITTVKVHFSEAITLYNTTLSGDDKLITYNGNTYKVAVDDDDDTVLDITAKTPSYFKPVTNGYKFNFSAFVKDLSGMKASDEGDVFNASDIASPDKDTALDLSIEDTDAPQISNVYAKTSTSVKVVYSENIARSGSYKLTYVDSNGNTVPVKGVSVSSPDDDTVTITTTDKLKSDTTYTLTVLTGARDYANNVEDKDFTIDFAGSDIVANDNYITGVGIVDASNITVSLSSSNMQPTSVTVTDEEGVTTTQAISFDHSDDTTSNNVSLGSYRLLSGETYTLTFTGKDTKSYSTTFNGVADTNNVTVATDAGTGNIVVDYSGKDTASQTIKVYKITGNYVDTTSATVAVDVVTGVATNDNVLVVVTDNKTGATIYAAKVTVQ